MIGFHLYSVVTLHDCMQDPASLAWLAHSDALLPGVTPPGRYPAPSEVRAVCDAIPGLRAAFTVGSRTWQAVLTSRTDVSWGILQIIDFTGDEAQPHRFCFSAGWDEVILLAASHLARICGPLVLLHDSGAPPQVVG